MLRTLLTLLTRTTRATYSQERWKNGKWKLAGSSLSTTISSFGKFTSPVQKTPPTKAKSSRQGSTSVETIPSVLQKSTSWWRFSILEWTRKLALSTCGQSSKPPGTLSMAPNSATPSYCPRWEPSLMKRQLSLEFLSQVDQISKWLFLSRTPN